MKTLLIVAGLVGFVFTLYQGKPPAFYFFLSTVATVGVWGFIFSKTKSPRPRMILLGSVAAVGLQQMLVRLMAHEGSGQLLFVQFVALQCLVVGGMFEPPGK